MNREQQLSDLLLRWEQLHEQGQSVTLHELCSDCPELIPELEQQIRAIRSMDALLGTEDAAADRSCQVGGNDAETVDESPSNGPAMSTQSKYRVIRSHAKGGLGEVLVAKDELLGREVALKVIRRPHDRDPQRRRRFVQEAEITSRLEHPGIVPVHGIGQDGDGRLCYTMRLISGETLHDAILKFHGSSELAADERARDFALRHLLGQFVSVCNTIAYAHSQGVIHRDLKPANIILGKYGETLVVDWGLAKELGVRGWGLGVSKESDAESASYTNPQPRTPTHSSLTQHGSAIGTPAFMSPEQSRGAWNDVGPASDIYSLGATLYMILTGRAPVEGRHIGEVMATVQAGDFPRPRQVKHGVSKPLEAICLKAMALAPVDRYASALNLAADTENWLGDQPVSAWREPLAVRVQRWIKRHRMIVTGAAAALVVGIAALVGIVALVTRSNRDLRLANDRESAAKTEAQKNAHVAETQSALAFETLQTVVDDIQKKLKDVPAAHEVRSDLLKTALEGLGKVAANLEMRVTVDRQTMLAHRALGDLFVQVGSDGERGGTEAAFRQYRRAFEIAEKLVADFPDDSEAERDLALAMSKLGDVCRELGSTEQSKHFYTESLRIRSKLKDAEPDDAAALRSLAMSFKQLGDLARKSGSVEQALAYFIQACEIREKLLAGDPNSPPAQRDLSVSFNAVGTAYLQLGSPDKSMEYHSRAVQLDERRVAAAPANTQARQDLAYSCNKLGDVLRHGGSFAAAREQYEKSLAIRQQIVDDDPTNAEKLGHLVVPNERIGKLCLMFGEHAAALEYFSRQHALLEQLIEADPVSVWNRRSLAVALDNIGDVYAKTDDLELALDQYRKSMAIREALTADAGNIEAQSDLAASLAKTGDMLVKLDQTKQALRLFHKAAASAEPIVAADPRNSDESRDLAAIYQRIGDATLTLDSTDEARTYFGKMVALLEGLIQKDPHDTESKAELAIGYQQLGKVDQRERRFPQAIEQFERSLDILRALEADRELDAASEVRIADLENAIADCKAALPGNEAAGRH